jgi:2-phospho-L-lactate guanylyltransferase (CobY/MobA/RfbA family)
MTPPPPTPTVVVFTLGAEAECSRRPLLPRSRRSLEADLRRRCLASALDAGRQLGWRLVVSTPHDLELPADVVRLHQSGDGFGERFADTLRRVEDLADGPYVLVGADSPDLTADHLREAVERLRDEPRDVVLGPCPDGGFYLLATSGSLDLDCVAVRWCGRRTLTSLRASLEASGRRVELLDRLSDLDHRHDLDRWLAGRASTALVWQPLVAALRSALAALSRPAPAPARDWIAADLTAVPLCRPPPTLSALR